MGLTYGNVSPTQIIYGGGGSSTIFSGTSTTTIDNGKLFSSFVTGFPITNSALKWKISGTITYNQYLFSATAIEQTKTFREISLVTGQPTYLLKEELLDNNGLVQYGQIYLTSNGQDIEIADACMKMFDSTHKKYTGFEALNITITKIEAELGTELTQLVYGSTTSWVKPFTLSKNQGLNTTLTINRTSSLNPEATIGNLSDGAVIYYGDELTISFSPASGYKIKTSKLNGTTIHSGYQVSVTESISVSVTAEASYSWHSIWTGSKSLTTSYQTITTNSNLPLEYKLHITTYNQSESYTYSQIVTIQSGESKTLYGDTVIGDEMYTETVGKVSLETTIASGMTQNIRVKVSTLNGDENYDPYAITITKIEAYY